MDNKGSKEMDEAVLKEDFAARGQYILSKNTLRSKFFVSAEV